MKVEIFCLCDFASTENNQKLNIIGVFDTIYANETPVTYGICALAAKVRFDRVQDGEQKKVKISFIDADGITVVPPLEFPITVRFEPDSTNSSAQIVSLMAQTKLPSFGDYLIELVIDGEPVASTPLFVKRIPLPK